MAHTLHIEWPAGLTQVVHDLTPGTLHVIEEPPTVTLVDPHRHAPADGVTTQEVRVTPRTPEGESTQR